MTEKIYSRLRISERSSRNRFLLAILLSPPYLLAALIARGPGIRFRVGASLLGLRMLFSKLGRPFVRSLVLSPMDSFRYFEFDFAWASLHKRDLGSYLDVSSPRLFSIQALRRHSFQRAVLLNPDNADLKVTVQLLEACGLAKRCEALCSLLEDFSCRPSQFNTIVSISVIEHIPGDGDILAMRRLWELLAPGGVMIITVPCAAKGFEEYVDFNEYGLQTPDKDKFVFGQRFYDERSLRERFFDSVGLPSHSSIYGETAPGTFAKDRQLKLDGVSYPSWREPLMMATEFSRFERISDLPGWGVIAMEFVKR